MHRAFQIKLGVVLAPQTAPFKHPERKPDAFQQDDNRRGPAGLLGAFVAAEFPLNGPTGGFLSRRGGQGRLTALSFGQPF